MDETSRRLKIALVAALVGAILITWWARIVLPLGVFMAEEGFGFARIIYAYVLFVKYLTGADAAHALITAFYATAPLSFIFIGVTTYLLTGPAKTRKLLFTALALVVLTAAGASLVQLERQSEINKTQRLAQEVRSAQQAKDQEIVDFASKLPEVIEVVGENPAGLLEGHTGSSARVYFTDRSRHNIVFAYINVSESGGHRTFQYKCKEANILAAGVIPKRVNTCEAPPPQWALSPGDAVTASTTTNSLLNGSRAASVALETESTRNPPSQINSTVAHRSGNSLTQGSSAVSASTPTGANYLPLIPGNTLEQYRTVFPNGPEPVAYQSPGTPAGLDAHLPSQGLRFFFDSNQRLKTIRLEAPYAGDQGGVHIGDTKDFVRSKLGNPVRILTSPVPNLPNRPVSWIYYLTDQYGTRFDFDAQNQVNVIFIFGIN